MYKRQELAELTCTPLSTIVRLVSGQTTNPTWDVMLSIAEGLDVPMDEFSTRQNKRTIRENEINHMQKYRVLGSSGRQAVDECLEREYVPVSYTHLGLPGRRGAPSGSPWGIGHPRRK